MNFGAPVEYSVDAKRKNSECALRGLETRHLKTGLPARSNLWSSWESACADGITLHAPGKYSARARPDRTV